MNLKKRIRGRISFVTISVLVCLVTMLAASFLPIVAHAEEIQQKSEEKIYYSDLFYGYDTSYLTNAYIEDYYDDVDDVARDIFNDYINSPRYFWTQIETSVAAALNAREFFELMSDTYGGTNFNYTDAIDSANILFAKELIGENDSMKMMGDIEKLTKKAGKIVSVCNDFEKIYNTEETHVVIIEKFFDTLAKSDVFDAYGKTYLSSIKTQFIAEAEAAGLWLSSTKELISYLKAISVGLMLEELRLEMLDDIIENSSGNQTIYTGMTRLRSQLVQGFSSYVVKTYMQDKVVDAIFSAMQKAITGQVSAYGFVSAVLKTASWVLFDVLWDIPNMDDMLVQMVLNEYVDGFHFILNNKASSFKLQFDSDDIIEYESLVEGFDASCRALLKASEKLTLSSNYSKLVAVKNEHKTFSYDNYIKVVKDIISATPEADRKIKKFHEWTINEATSFTPASDTIEDGHIYKFRDGFHGNLVVKTNFNIDSLVNIYGDISVKNSLTITKGSTLTVDGDITLEDSISRLFNHGTLNGVNLHLKSVRGYNGYYYQTETDAILNLTGNFTADSYDLCKITAGTIVFNGKEQQTVNNLKAYNVEVLNPEGIKYLSDVYLYGTYDLNGYLLDNNGYETYLYDNADIVPGSNYRDLNVNSTSGKIFSYDILCDNIIVGSSIIVGENVSVTVAENAKITGALAFGKGTNVTIGKGVTISGNLTVEKGSTLTVEGDIILEDSISRLFNYGTLNGVNLHLKSVRGYNGYYYQTETDAILNLTGNFTADSYDLCKITAGTIVFNGKEQQTLNNLKAYNVEVLNPNGIQYLSNVNVYGNFDTHQNPIDTGSYKTNFYDEGGFGTLPENQSDWIVSVQPTYTTVGERYKECLVCGEKICIEEIPVLVNPTPDECDHSFGEWSILSLPTCTQNGVEQRYCISCDYFEEREVDALGHDIIIITTISPTCTEMGYTVHGCSRCEDEKYQDSYVDPLGHSFENYISNNDATCVANGTETAKCDRCNETNTREDDKSALGHVEVVDTAVAPTCTETGLTEGKHCSVCYVVIVDQEVIPANGHYFDSVVTNPTCEEQGYTTHTCHCGEIRVDTYTDALGHSLGQWQTTEDPTCTGKGSERRNCDNCDYYETRATSPIGHSWIEEDGNEICTSCGEIIEKDSAELEKDHSECEAGLLETIINAIINFFRTLFGLPEVCICGEEY